MSGSAEAAGAAAPKASAPGIATRQPPSAAVPLIEAALVQLDDVDGWYPLGSVGKRLPALMPDFDPRTYGCAKLLLLIERSASFEIRREGLAVYIRPIPQG